MKLIIPPISFIEHLLAIPKTPRENADELEDERLDVQTRSIDLYDSCNNDKQIWINSIAIYFIAP